MSSDLALDPRTSRHWPAAAAALLWALAAGGVVLWWLQWPQPQTLQANDVGLTPMAVPGQDAADLMRALGHTQVVAVTPDAHRRFALMGVIATGSGAGSALLGVDGQPAQAFVQGQMVVDGWRLQSVSREGARLSAAEGGATLELVLPDRP